MRDVHDIYDILNTVIMAINIATQEFELPCFHFKHDLCYTGHYACYGVDTLASSGTKDFEYFSRDFTSLWRASLLSII